MQWIFCREFLRLSVLAVPFLSLSIDSLSLSLPPPPLLLLQTFSDAIAFCLLSQQCSMRDFNRALDVNERPSNSKHLIYLIINNKPLLLCMRVCVRCLFLLLSFVSFICRHIAACGMWLALAMVQVNRVNFSVIRSKNELTLEIASNLQRIHQTDRQRDREKGTDSENEHNPTKIKLFVRFNKLVNKFREHMEARLFAIAAAVAYTYIH